MDVQLKAMNQNVYPMLELDDTDGDVQLLSSLTKGALFPSVETLEGNCQLKVGDSDAYPIVRSVPAADPWAIESKSLTFVASGTYYQGLAIYNGYAIYFNDSSSAFNVKNVADGTTVVLNKNFQSGDSNRHTNTLNFGTLKYEQSDTYPLLYGSGNLGELITTIDVYRVVNNNGDWSVTKVQTIDFSNISSYGDVALWGDKMVIKNGATQGTVYICNCPPLYIDGELQATYTMQPSDVISQFNLTQYTYVQGYTIVGNYLLNLQTQNTAYNYLTIYNLTTGRKIADLGFNEDGVTFECEQFAHSDALDKFYLFTRYHGYYEVTFTPTMPTGA